MEEKQVDRKDIPSDYSEMMEKESHHHHIIIEDEYGTLRWKEKEGLRDAIAACGTLNEVVPLLGAMGWGKNSEQARDFYRNLGYSLSGYWEIFYWEVNNPECDDYKQYVLTPFTDKK